MHPSRLEPREEAVPNEEVHDSTKRLAQLRLTGYPGRGPSDAERTMIV